MERDYHTEPEEEVNFFVGSEVEATLAYGKRTLFVVGLQDPRVIRRLATKHACKHIYLGANMSFTESDQYCVTARYLLDEGFMVTVDFPITSYQWFADNCSSLDNYNGFIPMVSVPMPGIEKKNGNLCIKIDDIGFNQTNTGVWVHPVEKLRTYNSFTGWDRYTNDHIIPQSEIDNIQANSVT